MYLVDAKCPKCGHITEPYINTINGTVSESGLSREYCRHCFTHFELRIMGRWRLHLTIGCWILFRLTLCWAALAFIQYMYVAGVAAIYEANRGNWVIGGEYHAGTGYLVTGLIAILGSLEGFIIVWLAAFGQRSLNYSHLYSHLRKHIGDSWSRRWYAVSAFLLAMSYMFKITAFLALYHLGIRAALVPFLRSHGTINFQLFTFHQYPHPLYCIATVIMVVLFVREGYLLEDNETFCRLLTPVVRMKAPEPWK